jgi:hypothetical protein
VVPRETERERQRDRETALQWGPGLHILPIETTTGTIRCPEISHQLLQSALIFALGILFWPTILPFMCACVLTLLFRVPLKRNCFGLP